MWGDFMYNIGLDIGIASVGWAVIENESGSIVDLGVRLFSSRNADNNAERREKRSSRRLIRRRVTRLSDAKKVLSKAGFVQEDMYNHVSPYEIRVRGLESKLEKGEIYRAVTHIVKRRGISYLDEDSLDAKSEGQSFKDEVTRNARLLQEFTPGQIQLKRLKEGGKVRTGYNDQNEYQLNIFTVGAYAKELERILTKQQEFYPEITTEFIQAFVRQGTGEETGLIYRKRPYYHGPGNAANNSQYGRWAHYHENGMPANNIFDQLIGKDLIGEIRASGISLSAQKFNLLNDLNNLTINREESKLSTAEKNMILQYLMNDEVKTFGPKNLAKLLELEMKDIRGWRVDKNDKPQIHNMGPYRTWKNVFAESGIELGDLPIDTVDAIAKIITLNTDLDAVEQTIALELPDADPKLKAAILDKFHQLKVKGSNATWHSFSSKLIGILIPELINTSEEQNTIIERLKIKPELRNKFANLPHIPVEDITDEIFNPTASKSVRQALRVFNQLIDRYGKENIENVVIEMPRDKNEDDQKKVIVDIQKNNEKRKNDGKNYFLAKSGWTEEQFEANIRKGRFAAKLNYYYEQDGRCAYSGAPIPPEDLLNEKTEIDHIIPLSISLDDSINNKVLVTSTANQVKAQRSPKQAFDESGAAMGQTWDEFKAWVLDRKYKKYKRQLLLFEGDIFNPETRNKFVARNLNDTRYASREVLNAIQSFFSGSENHTKVQVVNGSFTHTLRKKWGNVMEKSRDTHHHHAVDAVLCAATPGIRVDKFKFVEGQDGVPYMLDQDTGELIKYHEYKKLSLYNRSTYTPKWDNFIEQLTPTRLFPRIKFSHQVDRKANRKISDATLYSTRVIENVMVKRGKEVKTEESYIIGKIKDIYSVEGWKAFDKNKEKLLMKEIDPKTYEKLIEISTQYPAKVEVQDQSGKTKSIDISPFKRYCEDNDVPYVTKYSKKGKGPAIKSLKYYDKKLGTHINITKDEIGRDIDKTNHNKQVVLLSTNPWRTDVYYEPSDGSYRLLGIKYNHLKFSGENYGIPRNLYESLKDEEGISRNAEFRFSLYRKDGIQITDGKDTIEGLFHSRTLPANPNYFEIKPIDKAKWEKKEYLNLFGNVSPSGQFVKGLKKNFIIRKFYTDYLGKRYFVDQEKLTGII